jgi:hypothetical protein
MRKDNTTLASSGKIFHFENLPAGLRLNTTLDTLDVEVTGCDSVVRTKLLDLALALTEAANR